MSPSPIAEISARISVIESRFRAPAVEPLASNGSTITPRSTNNGASFADAYGAASATATSPTFSPLPNGIGTAPLTVAVPWSQIPGAMAPVIGSTTHTGGTTPYDGATIGVSATGSVASPTPVSVPTGPAGQTLSSLDARSVAPGTPYADLFNAAGQRHGVPPRLLASIGWVESRYNPNALSPDGAQGVMQLMPFVSEHYGVDANVPAQAIDAAAQLLSEHHDRFGNWDLSVASYFSGAGAVSRAGNQPPTSRSHEYVRSVTERLPHV